MVPRLRGVVEQAGVLARMRGRDDRRQILVGKRRAGNGRIGLVDIGLVVLAVVKLPRLRRAVWRERVISLGQGGKRKRHGAVSDG